MNSIHLLILSLAALASSSVFADPATLTELTRVFESRFRTGYEPRKCGSNIVNLLEAMRAHADKLADAQVLVIQNPGGSCFGMVNAEQARDSGPRLATPLADGTRFGPGEANWYHHVVLVYDGYLFDFDYTNEPTVKRVADYFEHMFLITNGGCYGTRDNKLDYTLQSVSAMAYHSGANPTPSKIDLRDYLKGLLP